MGGDAGDRYPGGKGADGTFQWLLALMPTHAMYVEPFVGKGAIARRKPPALATLLFDKDPAVIRWWKNLRWPGVIAERRDGIHWLERHGRDLGSDCLVYCDPPYLPSTRRKLRMYRHELSARDHRRLLRASRNCSCPVMLSGYASTMYDEELAGWHRFTHWAITRGKVMREEVCWCNYDPEKVTPALAIRYEAFGRNFREREKVGRMVKTWTSRLRAMPAATRRAVAFAVLDAYCSNIGAAGDGAGGPDVAEIVAAASTRAAIGPHRGGERWQLPDLFGGNL